MGLLDHLSAQRAQYTPYLGLLYIALALLALLILLNPIRLIRKARKPPRHRSVAIVVLGDVGRSPRMMYHAESFAGMGWETFLVGYRGSKLIPSLLEAPHVREIYLREPPAFISKLPRLAFLLWAPYKILFQVYTVLQTLLGELPYPPEFILVQNPPSIPTLALVQLCCWLHGSKLIVDWHNLGYTILGLRLGKSNPVVWVAKMCVDVLLVSHRDSGKQEGDWAARRFEMTFGRKAYAHLFVTHAMQEVLVKDWKLEGIKAVLHDRPPAHFHPSETTEIHDLFTRLDLTSAGVDFFPPYRAPLSTPLTQLKDSSDLSPSAAVSPLFGNTLPRLRPDRPALVVSSTSWTPDEDFALLLNAMAFYEKRARAANDPPSTRGISAASKAAGAGKGGKGEKLPKILVIVTGKGPLRDKFMEDIEECQKLWRWVRCVPMWLEAADYPVLLGSADVGVSLHTSSSALDLPMKIVDMFGCGLPVCALGFDCLDELVKEGENGLIFRNALELAAQLEALLKGFPQARELKKLREGLEHQSSAKAKDGERWNTWGEEWDRVVKPIVIHRPGVQ
ncbi:glycosyltransferase family 33 protein [Calocera cornea HHB12733]|uniref:Chitobiosyldiphosphodolichol beta-mannosyltransferase n=1 Tax=Calocera cornea HHB12733 TaxID=1353952 RepID=A0A165GUK5_9BASI|nr:glycosyltransferase family 33 protein [Calocera cornea HHB12733]